MSTLLLKLAAPLQSWGDASRFTRRTTRHEPTKSAVLGLIAAAQGRRRTDSIEDLLLLKFAVRIDQPGTMMRDFHTAHDNKGNSMPLSERYYLSDAVFVVGLEADRNLLEGIANALLHPSFPLYLGRRSCTPSGKLVLDITDDGLVSALRNHPWEASIWYQRQLDRESPGEVRLPLLRDVLPQDTGQQTRETTRDIPHSFSQERRLYGWRDVIHDQPVVVDNPISPKPDVPSPPESAHDPMAVFEGL